MCFRWHILRSCRFVAEVTQLAQRRCDNVVTTSLLTLSPYGTVENELYRRQFRTL